jgi:AbrB family looped-hinge helix DNA binding protein
MPETQLRSLTMTSKGQITISSKARKSLGLEQGDTLIEIVVGNCIVLLPESLILGETARRAQEAIKRAGVAAEEIIHEADRQRVARLAEKHRHRK